MPRSRTSEVQNGGDRIFKKLMLILTFGKIWAWLGQSDTDGLGAGETQFHWEEDLANSIRKKATNLDLENITGCQILTTVSSYWSGPLSYPGKWILKPDDKSELLIGECF